MGTIPPRFGRALTVAYPGIVRVLGMHVGVGRYRPDTAQLQPENPKVSCIWDTGATHCVISKRLAESLGLKPIGKARVYGAHVDRVANRYLVNVLLPNKVMVEAVPVTDAEGIAGQFDFLIGMRLIVMGDFALTHLNGRTKLTFHIPPWRDIDFVREARDGTYRRPHGKGAASGCAGNLIDMVVSWFLRIWRRN